MKRVKSGVARSIKSPKFRKVFIVLAIFSLGMIAGFGLKSILVKNQQTTADSKSTTQSRSQSTNQRLEDSLKRAQERIQKDVEAKRIEQK